MSLNKPELYLASEIKVWITAVLIFLLALPYFSWSIAPFLLYISLLPLAFIFYTEKDTTQKPITFVLFFAYLSFVVLKSGEANIFGYISGILPAFVFIINNKFAYCVYEKFRLIFIGLMSLSIISMCLVLIGIPLPVSYLQPINELKSALYIVYPFWVVGLVGDMSASSARFMGIFDEPGVVGTLSLLLLTIEKSNLKRRGNFVILLCGLLSMSLFFYVAFAGYLIFRLFQKGMSGRNRIAIISVLLLGAFLVSRSPMGQELIVDRLIYDKEQEKLSGDNRSDEALDEYIESIRGTNEYYWGGTSMIVRQYFSNSASIKNAILNYGLIAIVLYFLFYYYYSSSLLDRKYKALIFLFFLYIILYNRPSMMDVCRIFLYNMVLLSYSPKSIELKS